jgi:hypothetical protein
VNSKFLLLTFKTGNYRIKNFAKLDSSGCTEGSVDDYLTHGLLTCNGLISLLCILCSLLFCDIVLLCGTVFLLCIVLFIVLVLYCVCL